MQSPKHYKMNQPFYEKLQKRSKPLIKKLQNVWIKKELHGVKDAIKFKMNQPRLHLPEKREGIFVCKGRTEEA